VVYCLSKLFYIGSQLLIFEQCLCSIMVYFLLPLLLLAITYDNCDSIAENIFASIQHHSSSLAYIPAHHRLETIFLLSM
jgi:hypothetical protein